MERREFLSAGIASGAILAATVGSSMSTAAEAADLSHFRVDGALLLQAYRSLVEEHLAGVLRDLSSLAATSDARENQWASIRPALARMNSDLTTAAAVWYAGPDGSYATVEQGPTGQTIGNRAYFPRLLAGHDVVGDLVISKSTGRRSVIIAAPVLKQGKVTGVLGASLRAMGISQMVIDRVGMPDSLTFYALDQHGQTAIHREAEHMFQFPSDMGDNSLKSAVQVILSQPRGVVKYRFAGTDRTAIFDTSQLTGWHFVLARVTK